MNEHGRLGLLIRHDIKMDRATYTLHEIIWQIITGNGYLFECELRKDAEGKVHLFVPKQRLDPSSDPAFALSTPSQREKLGVLGPITSSDFIKRALLHETGIIEVEHNVFVHSYKVFRLVPSDEGDALYIEDPRAAEMPQHPPRPPRRPWGKRR